MSFVTRGRYRRNAQKKPPEHRVLSTRKQPPESGDHPVRYLFINWKDGEPPSQFSVPDDYTLERKGLRRRRLPPTLVVFNAEVNGELYLNTKKIKSAMLVTIGDDQKIIET